MRRHWMMMIIIIWWRSLHCIILLYIALQKCRYTHCWSQWVGAPSNWHGGPIHLCATLWATLCHPGPHCVPHYAIGSFTYPLAAGSEAGNLSMPYYATPYHTMPFYYAIAILLQHWHPQHTMTLAIQVANWVYQSGPLHNQCGLHGVLYAISMYLLYIWPCTQDSPLYKEAHHMNWFNTSMSSMSSIVRSPLDDLCMDIWISAMIIIRTQITSERQVY